MHLYFVSAKVALSYSSSQYRVVHRLLFLVNDSSWLLVSVLLLHSLLSFSNSNFLYSYILLYIEYHIAGFCLKDFNVASHRIRNIKIHYIFYHVRFCNCLVLCLYFSISLRSKWGLFQTLKEHYLMHESIQNSNVLAIVIY